MEIDLNKVDSNGEVLESPSPVSSCSPSSSVCLELWRACAGPVISLPRKGTIVVYFPQGHLEQAPKFRAFAHDIPPHLFCRVLNVNLHAEIATDEVYAQVSLVPEPEVGAKSLDEDGEGNGEEEEIEELSTATPHMFCKTLTASDTSTHGGFSVPRRAAEDCFPALDYKQQRPSQELVAKDLHGVEWKFRHIYRGQPRRHLLTTGWSSFVNQKKLVSGDAVLFLRGENGELRLGIRRAARPEGGVPYSILCSQNLNLSALAAVSTAVSTKSMFHVYYNPRASPAEFIIPYRKFSKSINQPLSIGTRFKMRYETEDATEQRPTGLITGIGDIDPVRWPGSKWRCLMVRWDEEAGHYCQDKVSPWEIEPSGSLSGFSSPLTPGSKKPRISLPSIKADFPFRDGTGISDFGESLGFQKVLQGQEILGFKAPYGSIDGLNHHLSEIRRCYPGANSSGIAGIGSGIGTPRGGTFEISDKRVGFGESDQFQKVLQGQEIFPLKQPYGRPQVDIRVHENSGFGLFEGFHMSGSRWPLPVQGYATQVQSFKQSPEVSSPSSVLRFQRGTNNVSYPYFAYGINHLPNVEEQGRLSGFFDRSKLSSGPQISSLSSIDCREDRRCMYPLDQTNRPGNSFDPTLISKSDFKDRQSGEALGTSCRLFGFPLTKEAPVANTVDPTPVASQSAKDLDLKTCLPTANSMIPGKQLHAEVQSSTKTAGRSCTKVHRQGNLVGRAIDLSKLDGYDDLITELERLFNMEGLLNDPGKGWQVVYTDDEDDMMLVGDDPWQEFCNIVSKILIYTHDEVELMVPGGTSDDAHSCSEEAPATVTSMSSLDCPDSSPTATGA
uniref:Auxin response factor n=1 Tax=Illicium parviflorum TaxID=13099 RepID=E1UHX4_ILLPA|nr:putative auxin response factor 3 [Illicium parviflorum]